MYCFTFAYLGDVAIHYLKLTQFCPEKSTLVTGQTLLVKSLMLQPRVSIGDSCEISNPIHSFGAFLLPPSHLECQPLTDSSSKTFMR